MTATERLMAMDGALIPRIEPPEEKRYHSFMMMDQEDISWPTGIECEVGEFLYGLVRMMRPTAVLETGTRLGVSARYICLALRDNDHGELVTLERDQHTGRRGYQKICEAGLADLVTYVEGDSMEYSPCRDFQLMWLDSEPTYRFPELQRYWNWLPERGVAAIHDCGVLRVGPFSGTPSAKAAMDWAFNMMAIGRLHAMTFATARGLTLLQKRCHWRHVNESKHNWWDKQLEGQ